MNDNRAIIWPVQSDQPLHHLTIEQKAKDAKNRAALRRDFPHYAAAATFRVVERAPFYHDGQRWIIRDQTVMVISFAAERAKDPAPADVQQLPIWGQVDDDKLNP